MITVQVVQLLYYHRLLVELYQYCMYDDRLELYCMDRATSMKHVTPKSNILVPTHDYAPCYPRGVYPLHCTVAVSQSNLGVYHVRKRCGLAGFLAP